MGSSFVWTADAKSDIIALTRDAFMAKYPSVSRHAYRHQLEDQRRRVENSQDIPIAVEEDGLYHTPNWMYTERQPVAPVGIEKHLNIGDTHGAFVDQRVWAGVLDFIRYFKPDQVNLLGDIVDFYDVSRYAKNPNRRLYLHTEIEFTRDVILGELRRAVGPRTKIVWVEGNHEARLQKYLWTRAPELASLPGLDMREVFRLKALNITYLQQPLEVGSVVLTHGHMARKHSGWTAKAMLEDLGQSVVHNHTHRLGAIYKTDRSGEYVAFENGCLCRMDAEYINGIPNWQHGFSVGWVLPSGRFQFQQVAIVDGKFVFDGRFFGADEPLDHCHD